MAFTSDCMISVTVFVLCRDVKWGPSVLLDPRMSSMRTTGATVPGQGEAESKNAGPAPVVPDDVDLMRSRLAVLEVHSESGQLPVTDEADTKEEPEPDEQSVADRVKGRRSSPRTSPAPVAETGSVSLRPESPSEAAFPPPRAPRPRAASPAAAEKAYVMPDLLVTQGSHVLVLTLEEYKSPSPRDDSDR